MPTRRKPVNDSSPEGGSAIHVVDRIALAAMLIVSIVIPLTIGLETSSSLASMHTAAAGAMPSHTSTSTSSPHPARANPIGRR